LKNEVYNWFCLSKKTPGSDSPMSAGKKGGKKRRENSSGFTSSSKPDQRRERMHNAYREKL
jgi:hypothetical protein